MTNAEIQYRPCLRMTLYSCKYYRLHFFCFLFLFSFHSDMSDVERTYAYCHILWSFHGCHVSSSSGKIRSLIMIKNKNKMRWSQPKRVYSLSHKICFSVSHSVGRGPSSYPSGSSPSLWRFPLPYTGNSSKFKCVFLVILSFFFFFFLQFSSNAINYSLQFKMIFHTKGNNLKKGLILYYTKVNIIQVLKK